MYGLYKNVKHKPAIVKLAVIVTPNLTVAIMVAPKMRTSNNADVRYTIHFNTGILSTMPTKPAKVNSPKNVHVANVPPITIAISITNAKMKVFIRFIFKC